MAMTTADFPRFFLDQVGRPLRTAVSLRDYSNFRIGGPADFFFEAATLGDLRAALGAARAADLRHVVIGGGYNLLFDDAGFRGLIVKNAARGIEAGPGEGVVRALGGTPLEELTAAGRDRSLAGLEFLAGIPGTVGGALVGNAGAFGRSIGEFLIESLLLEADGCERTAFPRELDFAYRHSRLKAGGGIVLSASFRLEPGDRKTIAACMDSYLALRAERHPSRGMAYAGSYFKNPASSGGTRSPAGKLLDLAGARDLTAGGAAVYRGHCNFIYNTGTATAADVQALAAMLKTRVRDLFGVELEEEVRFLPAEPSGV